MAPLKITVKGANSAQRAPSAPGQPAPQVHPTGAAAWGAQESRTKLAHDPVGCNGLPRVAQQVPGGALSAHGASGVSGTASGAVSGSSGGNPLKKKLSLKIKKADPSTGPALTPAQQIANEVNNRFLPPASQAPVSSASAAAPGVAAAASTGSVQRKIISIKRSSSGPGGPSITLKSAAAPGSAPPISFKRPLGADAPGKLGGPAASGPRSGISIKPSSSISPAAPAAAAGGDAPAAKRPRITPHGVVGGQARQTLNRYLPGGRGRGRGRGGHTSAPGAGPAHQNHPIVKRHEPHPPSVGGDGPAAAGDGSGGRDEQQAEQQQQPQPAATPPKPVQASSASALPTAAAAAAAFAASKTETVVLAGSGGAAAGGGAGGGGQVARGPISVKVINVKGTAGSGGSGGVLGARGASAGKSEGATTAATGSGGVAGGVLGVANGQMQLLPDVPVSDALLKQLLGTIEKKDKFRIFAVPVTEAVAPGYFSIISRPMDLQTIKEKLGQGEYRFWDDLKADLDLMFTNAKTYNPIMHPVWKSADRLHEESNRLLIDYRTGKTGLRGKPAIAKKPEGQQPGADGQAAPAENPPPPRAAAMRARNFLPKAGRGRMRARGGLDDDAPRRSAKLRTQYNINDFSTVVDGENPRTTFRPAARKELAQWRGLAGGATAEGQAFGAGRALLRCPMGNINNLPPEMYLGSFARFVAGAGPKIAALAMQMMGATLEGMVSEAYVPPPPAPTVDLAAAAELPGAVQVQQQQQMPVGGAVAVAPSIGAGALGGQGLPLALQQVLLGTPGMGGAPGGVPPGAAAAGVVGPVGPGLSQLPAPVAPGAGAAGLTAVGGAVPEPRVGAFAPTQQLQQQPQQVGTGGFVQAAAVAAGAQPRAPSVASMAPPGLPLSSIPGGAPKAVAASAAPAGVLDLTGVSSGPFVGAGGAQGLGAAAAGIDGVGGAGVTTGGLGGGYSGAGVVRTAGGPTAAHAVVSSGMAVPLLQQHLQQQQLGMQAPAGWPASQQPQGSLQSASLPHSQQQKWNPAAQQQLQQLQQHQQPARQQQQLQQGLMLGSEQELMQQHQDLSKAASVGAAASGAYKAYSTAPVGSYQAGNPGDVLLGASREPQAPPGLPPQAWPAAPGAGQLWPGQQG